MSKYQKCIDQWDDIFSNEELKLPKKRESGNKQFDNGLAWLTKDATSVLDFGCGNGTVLFLCGGIETLKEIPDESVDSAILSNIVDNLF